MLRSSLICVLGLLLLASSGCMQAHSDDGLRTVPSTNNPNLIHDSNRNTSMIPGMGY